MHDARAKVDSARQLFIVRAVALQTAFVTIIFPNKRQFSEYFERCFSGV